MSLEWSSLLADRVGTPWEDCEGVSPQKGGGCSRGCWWVFLATGRWRSRLFQPFYVGPKSESPGSPDYVPLVHPHQILNVVTGYILSTVSRIEGVQQRARMAVARGRSEQEERQWLLHIQKAADHDHGYCLLMNRVLLWSIRKQQ